MRDLFFLIATMAGIGATLIYPFAGVLLWTWLSVMSPQSDAYGFARTLPLNMIVAGVTVASVFISRERKLPSSDALLWLCAIFLAWCTLNGFAAVDPDWSWPYWDRTWKVFALGLFAATLAHNKLRLHALTWVVVISLFYYSVKGGLFTILSGGGSHVYGPDGTIIGDNNQLALALLMTLPLANYLRSQSANRWVSWALIAAMGLTVVAVLGTYSRGGFIGLAVLCLAALLRVRNKLIYLVVAGTVLVSSLYFMPNSFFSRLHSIDEYGTDSSFQGRVTAWHVAYNYARDHFPFGAGFYGPQLAQVFHTYFPNEAMRAAHSIYFQVLGEQGFLGLALYLLILVGGFIKAHQIARASRNNPEKAWAGELAAMIQLGLLVFCLSGAALSMAYYDVFVLYLAMLLSLHKQVAVVAADRKLVRLSSPARHPLAAKQ
ncbi:MAG: putative O-glycosylation ligase, exosortase A system-associated [Alphaproteobacteria bacterium]|nr:putative O-glycosylation ligase, exosortase A system-associated [Alphaproteobacteria bacterium]